MPLDGKQNSSGDRNSEDLLRYCFVYLYIEVTPAPFAAGQRLPYVPPVPKPDTGGPVFSSGASGLDGIGRGAAAASAIIAPSPGGVAGE